MRNRTDTWCIDSQPLPRSFTPKTDESTTLIGASAAIRQVLEAVDLVADSDTAVLLTGESGTGKDVVARMIHQKSKRGQQPFIALNCAALPADVIENELFGHEQEAFTGALSKKSGCFELANNGTLFFDEIAEMNPYTQAKLLRVIESKSFRRLGGRDEVCVDVRTLAATNKDIATALKQKELRGDLYHRFSVIEIAMPPLRERKEDIPLLIGHFLSAFGKKHSKPECKYSQEAMELLVQYDWPGNVRELKNVVERCVVISKDPLIRPHVLPTTISASQPRSGVIMISIGTPMHEIERKVICETLAAVENNKSEAARVLQLSRRGLQKKLQKFNNGGSEVHQSPGED